MLNEWSDRRPPGPPRPRLLRAEFWVGVFAVAVWVALVWGFVG